MRPHLLTLIIIILTACTPGLAPAPDPTRTASSAPLPETIQPTAIPTQTDPTQMLPNNLTPAPELENLIGMIKEDLAQRLSISASQINLVEVGEVEWSDSSLDCPQPGMEYLQIITPGYRILLETSGNVYEYHSNRDTYFIYCENPFLPNLPKP